MHFGDRLAGSLLTKFNEGDLECLFSLLSANSSEQPPSAPSHISYWGLQTLSHLNGMYLNCWKHCKLLEIGNYENLLRVSLMPHFFQGGIHVPGSNECCTGMMSCQSKWTIYIVCRKGNSFFGSQIYVNLQEDLTGFMAAASKFQIKGLSEEKVCCVIHSQTRSLELFVAQNC